MSETTPEKLLLMGKIIRPHGLEGAMRVQSYAESHQSFLRAGTVILKVDKGEFHEFKVLSIRPHKRILLMKLKGFRSFEEAERFRGAEVFIKKDFVRNPDRNEYYWYEIIGLKVYLSSGRYIGTITDIIPTGSNDIYISRDGESEVLIPATHDVVKEIDLEEKRMIITPMEGLLEVNEI